MDLINLRKVLNENIDGLLSYTLKLQEEYELYKKNTSENSLNFNNNLQTLTDENISLNKKLIEKDKHIENITRDFNKTKTDYENIINASNQKLEELQKEEDNKNRHDMIKSQAKELDEKDRVIEILQNKLMKYSEKNKSNTSVEDKLNDIVNTIEEPVEYTGKIVFTDGACSENGNSCAKAGIGVYFGDGDERNVSKRIPGKQTNNTAELSAILEVFDICEKELDNGDKLTIYSDSDYSIKSFTTRGDSYSKKDWKKYNGDEIENLELVKKGYELFKKYPNVSIKHVKAHTGNTDVLSLGNRMADKLATDSLNQPDIKEDKPEEEVEPDKPEEDKVEEDKVEEEAESSEESEDDDEVLIKIKYKKVYYYIVKDENPQYVYNILEEGVKGDKVGERKIVNNKKKYTMY